MNYSDSFDEYDKLLFTMDYVGPDSLKELKTFMQGIIAMMELKNQLNAEFIIANKHHQMQLKIDLKIVTNAIKSKSADEKQKGFYEAKIELSNDLRLAASKLKFMGF
jgi:hypothetical protein